MLSASGSSNNKASAGVPVWKSDVFTVVFALANNRFCENCELGACGRNLPICAATLTAAKWPERPKRPQDGSRSGRSSMAQRSRRRTKVLQRRIALGLVLSINAQKGYELTSTNRVTPVNSE